MQILAKLLNRTTPKSSFSHPKILIALIPERRARLVCRIQQRDHSFTVMGLSQNSLVLDDPEKLLPRMVKFTGALHVADKLIFLKFTSSHKLGEHIECEFDVRESSVPKILQSHFQTEFSALKLTPVHSLYLTPDLRGHVTRLTDAKSGNEVSFIVDEQGVLDFHLRIEEKVIAFERKRGLSYGVASQNSRTDQGYSILALRKAEPVLPTEYVELALAFLTNVNQIAIGLKSEIEAKLIG